MSSLECDGGDERTRVFAESFLKEGLVSAHANAENTAQTSATSKIFLNGMFAFTFTVTSVRKRHNLGLRTSSRQRRQEGGQDARKPEWLTMRLSLGFESSGSDIAINGGWGRGIGDEAWLSSVARGCSG